MRIFFGALPLLVAFLWLFPSPVAAETWYPREFSAEIQWPEAKSSPIRLHGKIFVGQGRIRTEATLKGHDEILILLTRERKTWTLNPNEKTYYEGLGQVPLPPRPDMDRLPGDENSRCASQSFITCKKIGLETLEGRATEKWLVHITRQEQTMEQTLWVDPLRHVILKQQPDKGPVIMRKMTDLETREGRATENWLLSQSFQGQTRVARQWVDKELFLIVQHGNKPEEGLTIHNIQVAPQPDSLFQIPGDYKPIKVPERPTSIRIR